MTGPGRMAKLLVSATALLAALGVASIPASLHADEPSPSFSIDLVPGGDIDASRSVAVGSRFSVSVVLDTFTEAPYRSYQVLVEYDDDVLDGDAGLPANWDDAPVADVSGGNLAVFPNGPLCDPSPTTQSISPPEDDSGTAQISMTCADLAIDGRSSYAGALVEIVFLCEEAGTADLTLTDVSNTFVLAENFDTLNDHVHDASVTCGGDAPTATVAPPTATPGATSPTPAAGEPTVAAPAPTTPSGGAAPTGVSGPDTGTGHVAGSGGMLWMVLVGAGVFIVAGASLNVAGAAIRRGRRR